MYTFVLFLLVALVFYLWFGKRKYVNFTADYRKRVKELESEVKKLKVIDWEELEKEKSKELIVIQNLIEKQEELLESLKSDMLSALQWRRGRIREHTEKLYPERIIGPYDQKLVEEKYKKVKKELKNYSNPTIAFILGVEYPHEKGYGFELKVSPYFAILLLDHLDMVIDHKIGNPYKKGLAKCREIVEKSFEEVYCYVPAFFPYKIKDTYIEDKMTAIRLKYEIEEYKARQVEERRAILQAQREELAAQREIEREIQRARKDEQEAQAKL